MGDFFKLMERSIWTEVAFLNEFFLNFLIWFNNVISDAKAGEKRAFEMHENRTDPLRCPVKLYEFYLSKW